MPPPSDARQLWQRLEALHQIGIALSAEKDLDVLLEKILAHARELTRADAGTVYVKERGQDCLRFAVLHNESQGLHRRSDQGEPNPPEPVPLHLPDGRPNHHSVAAYVALTQETVNIADAYRADGFDFSGTKEFDRRSGYRSTSFLTVPMLDHRGEVLGVLQLINAKDPGTGETQPFSRESELWIRSLASQASVVLDNRQETQAVRELAERLQRLSEIGVALSAEKDIHVLLERILADSKWLTRADGGTLYLLAEDGAALEFAIVRNDTLGIQLGGAHGEPASFAPVPLYLDDGKPNHHSVAAHVALTGQTVSIADAYEAEGFDFSGTRRFDAETGYRSRSFLNVPLKDHEDELLGVLQLINARPTASEEVIAFSPRSQRLVEALASQAAVALTNRNLIEGLKELFDAFIRSLATAIDRKSPFTGGHCQRVPVLTLMIADAAARETDGPLAAFTMNGDQRYELGVAAWLHDCGKVATPEHVMDKSTKLETIFDRIETVRTRFEVVKRDAEIAWLRQRVAAAGDDPAAAATDEELSRRLSGLAEDLALLERANIGGEFMDEALQERVRQIGRIPWVGPDGEERSLLTEDEVKNLTISKGTLTPEERQIINDHVVVSIEMLEQLPYPKKLRNVPEFAGGHHEKVDGTGYPRGLRREQMSWPARMMAIADIFEALTAPDRPYREPNTLSQALRILGLMKEDGHVDPDLFDLFVRRKVYREYSEQHLSPQQIDEVDETRIPGYRPRPVESAAG